MKYKYQHAAVGGTFDLLHKGHEEILHRAFKTAQKVTIGQTTDNFCKQSAKRTYQNQSQRRKRLQTFLKNNGYLKRAKIIWLADIFGNTTKDPTVQALVVSKETLAGVKQINIKRQKLKLKKLNVIICPQVLASDKKPISSTRIRRGEISTTGLVYRKSLLKLSQKALPTSIKLKLKKPFGKIVKIDATLSFPQKRESRNKQSAGFSIESRMTSPGELIAVGDISVSQLLKHKILPKISIVDFYVKRKLTFHNLTQLGFGSANADVIVKNPAGTISRGIILQIEKALAKPNSTVILVDGEEDLAAVPSILLSPLGYTVIYGQPNKGAVLVYIDTKIKDSLCNLLGLN